MSEWTRDDEIENRCIIDKQICVGITPDKLRKIAELMEEQQDSETGIREFHIASWEGVSEDDGLVEVYLYWDPIQSHPAKSGRQK